MTVRVTITLKTDNVPEAIQQVVFALQETLGEGLSRDLIARVEASRP